MRPASSPAPARTLARALVVALALALVAPSALAQWRGVGTLEPDTPWDVAQQRMFAAPDTDTAGARVYFDAFATQGGPEPWSPLNGANVNPNVGLVGSRIQPAGLVQWNAFLGIWKDCNADGYIGLAEGGVQEYRSELLTRIGGNGICPVGGSFNDGAWVAEFLFIGMVDPCQFETDAHRAAHCNGITGVNQVPAYIQNPRVLHSNDTYVWGDWGAPGARPKPPCPLPPFARGSTAGAGSLLAVADCQDGRLVARALAASPANASSVLDARFPVNLFGDPESGRAGLAQQDSGDPAFEAWDCGAPRSAEARDPTGGLLGVDRTVEDPSGGSFTGNQPIPVVGQQKVFPLRVRTQQDDGTIASAGGFAPTVRDPTGSWWDAASRAVDGVGPAGDCDADTNTRLDDLYAGDLVESDRAVVSPYKSSNDIVMTFSRGYRGESHLDARCGGCTSTTPDDGGVVYTRNLYGGPLWMANAPTLADPDVVDRSELAVAGARSLTFYARLNESDVLLRGWELPTRAPGAYGAEWCGTHTAGEWNGWECDPALWYKAADGSSTMPHYAEGRPIGQLPGAPYHMLDVDCFDGQLARGVPVYAGGAALGVAATCGT